MTEPEDREPKTPEKDAWLPPRLREKLGDAGGADDDEDFLRKKPANMIPGLIATAIVLGALGGVAFMIWGGIQKERAGKAKIAEAARQQVVADSLARALVDSLARARATAIRDSIDAFMKTPAGRRAFARARADSISRARAAAAASQPAAGTPVPASTGGSEAAPAAAPEGPFGIQVAHYLDEAQANAKLAELKAAAKLEGQVISEEGTFNVVLGKFSSKGAANARMEALMSKGVGDEYIVVKLPK